jgi:hypothetical protein
VVRAQSAAHGTRPGHRPAHGLRRDPAGASPDGARPAGRWHQLLWRGGIPATLAWHAAGLSPSAHASRTRRTGLVRRRVAARGPRRRSAGPRAGLEETDVPVGSISAARQSPTGFWASSWQAGRVLDRQRPALAKLLGAPVPFHEGPQDAASRGKSTTSIPGVPWGELTHGTWLQRPCHWAYIENHKGFIPNDGERYGNGERISTGFVESTVHQVVSKRFCKKHRCNGRNAPPISCYKRGSRRSTMNLVQLGESNFLV